MKVKKWNDWRSEDISCVGNCGHFKRSPYRLLQRLILAGWENKANFRNMDDDSGMDRGLKIEFYRITHDEKTEQNDTKNNNRKELSDEEFIFQMEKKTRFYGRRMTPEELKRYQTIKEKIEEK